MSVYRVKFYMYSNVREIDKPRQSEEVIFETVNEAFADKVVDEILYFRATGNKSAFLHYLEDEQFCFFKQTSTSVITIEKIDRTYVRKAGGLFDIARHMKEAIKNGEE